MKRLSALLARRATPGVSTKTIWPPLGRCQTPTIRLRVVCGLGVTMASFSPTMRLSSVDLPTFGRPENGNGAGDGAGRGFRGHEGGFYITQVS